MQELIKKTKNIINNYKDKLSKAGIKIDVSKRYFETSVSERTHSNIINLFVNDTTKHHQREVQNGYNYEKNKYTCIVIKVTPIEDGILQSNECRDYSFIFIKTERSHIGEEPKHIKYDENKILLEIEKRILKILKKAKNHSPKKVCKNTLKDAFRYSHCTEYQYMDEFLGKKSLKWDFIFAISVAIFVFMFFVILWSIGKLF